MKSMTKDLIVARGSLVFLVVGSLGIAWGPVPGLFILGVFHTLSVLSFTHSTFRLLFHLRKLPS